MRIVPFSDAHSTDLRVDTVYQGGRKANAGDDPLPRLLKVSNSGGFRYRGQVDALELVVLMSSGKDADWPDAIDRETGVYTYYGDNKSPGRGLHETPRKGNELLRKIFALAHSGLEGRLQVPPLLLFVSAGKWRDVVFLGLAVPGTANLRASEDLVAIWRISEGMRFQNYRARFSVLNVSTLSRAWIEDIIAGHCHTPNAPSAWSRWVRTGRIPILRATRSIEYRAKSEQVPETPHERSILKLIHGYFENDPHGFERCAAELARLLLPKIVEIDLTRPSRDGGRDAVGQFRIGSGASGILVDFALEAKCYSVSAVVGVKDVSRLISRLRHRQFGILVTTSYVSLPAYREIKEDQHPVIIIAGADIVTLLRKCGYASPDLVQEWLDEITSAAG